jgi:hypothetical protein
MEESVDYQMLLRTIRMHEERIAALEARLAMGMDESLDVSPEAALHTRDRNEDAIELQIGQNWFARLGIVILTIGLAFVLTFPYGGLPAIAPSLGGYVLAGGIITLALLWRTSYAHLSTYLLSGGITLSYVATLRLTFFTQQPVVTDPILLAALLGGSVFLGLFLADRTASVALAVVSLVLGYTAALLADSALFLFLSVTTLSIISTVFSLRHRQEWLLPISAGWNITTHFLWFLNNPVLGHTIGFVSSPVMNTYFVLAYAAVIAAGSLWRMEQKEESAPGIMAAVVNGGGAYALYLLLTITKFREGFAISHLLASGVFLTVAVMFWVRARSQYSTFVYAMLGYAALSAAIIAAFGAPEHFIWLSLQSILVISTAVWFRSRFIIVANFIIYLALFVAYLLVAQQISLVSICFGAVALLSARILNAQKDRLELKTEYMRNAYLGTAFFMIPYALYHTVPPGFVSLSWLAVALVYYMMSRAVRSRKYRWMALLTLAITIPYALLFDMTRLDPAYRIVSFVILGTVLLVVSVVYSRRRGTGGAPPAPSSPEDSTTGR